MQKFVIFIFIIPIWFVVLMCFKEGPSLNYRTLVDSGVFTFKQAFLSSAISILFGTLGALGLIGFSGVKRKVFEVLFLLPTAFPSLFLILSVMNFTEIFIEFPYGLSGIVFIHSFINIGLAAVLIAKLVEQKLGSASVWAWLSGINKFDVLYHGVLKSLKWDIARVYFVIFIFSWCSFTVPYLVGNIGQSTLEVLLFEQIKIYSNWSQAAVIALFQLIIIWLIGLFFLKQDIVENNKINTKLNFLSVKILILFPFFIFFILMFGSFRSLVPGVKLIFQDIDLIDKIWKTSVVSLTIGFTTAFFTFIFSLSILWSWSKTLRKFFILYQAPSALILGFMFIYYFGNNKFPILVTSASICLLYIPFLYKLSLDSKYLSLQNYHKTASLLGASKSLCFFKVSLPLSIGVISLCSAIAGFWAVGDYALSALFLSSNPSLPIFTEQMISTYRFELASALIWINLLVGAFVFLTVLGVGYVYSYKFKA